MTTQPWETVWVRFAHGKTGHNCVFLFGGWGEQMRIFGEKHVKCLACSKLKTLIESFFFLAFSIPVADRDIMNSWAKMTAKNTNKQQKRISKWTSAEIVLTCNGTFFDDMVSYAFAHDFSASC